MARPKKQKSPNVTKVVDLSTDEQGDDDLVGHVDNEKTEAAPSPVAEVAPLPKADPVVIAEAAAKAVAAAAKEAVRKPSEVAKDVEKRPSLQELNKAYQRDMAAEAAKVTEAHRAAIAAVNRSFGMEVPATAVGTVVAPSGTIASGYAQTLKAQNEAAAKK